MSSMVPGRLTSIASARLARTSAEAVEGGQLGIERHARVDVEAGGVDTGGGEGEVDDVRRRPAVAVARPRRARAASAACFSYPVSSSTSTNQPSTGRAVDGEVLVDGTAATILPWPLRRTHGGAATSRSPRAGGRGSRRGRPGGCGTVPAGGRPGTAGRRGRDRGRRDAPSPSRTRTLPRRSRRRPAAWRRPSNVSSTIVETVAGGSTTKPAAASAREQGVRPRALPPTRDRRTHEVRQGNAVSILVRWLSRSSASSWSTRRRHPTSSATAWRCGRATSPARATSRPASASARTGPG